MVDHEPADSGEPLALFESGAIMIYIAEKAGLFYPQELRGRHEVNQWVIWQMANQGPKTGECGHFLRLKDSEGDQSYAVRRLYDRRYLAGDEYTIADMISYPWSARYESYGQEIEEFSYFKRWFEDLSARPGVQRGMDVGSDMSVDTSKLTPEDIERLRGMLYNQRARPAPAGGLL
jgi:GST-like protein